MIFSFVDMCRCPFVFLSLAVILVNGGCVQHSGIILCEALLQRLNVPGKRSRKWCEHIHSSVLSWGLIRNYLRGLMINNWRPIIRVSVSLSHPHPPPPFLVFVAYDSFGGSLLNTCTPAETSLAICTVLSASFLERIGYMIDKRFWSISAENVKLMSADKNLILCKSVVV